MNVYEIITEKVIEKLEAGVVPWQKPWSGGEMPKSLVRKKEYRGLNSFMLNLAPYESKYWVTWKDVQKLDGSIKKGEKSSIITYWQWKKKIKEDGEEEIYPLFKYYRVFNLEQCDGIEEPINNKKEKLEFKPIKEAEKLIEEMPGCPPIKYESQSAYYVPGKDYINMPEKESFISVEKYYSTLFHELVHSTGHQSRLNRKGITERTIFGSKLYSKEELIAEMGAAFLCGHTGIENAIIDNSAAYIDGWLKKLREDSKFIAQVAAQAQKAADYIRNVKYEV